MVSPEDGGVPGEVIKVVHDDRHKEVEHEEGAEEDEGDKVHVGEVGAAGLFVVLPRGRVEGEAERVALSTGLTGQHDAGPGLARSASGREKIKVRNLFSFFSQ